MRVYNDNRLLRLPVRRTGAMEIPPEYFSSRILFTRRRTLRPLTRSIIGFAVACMILALCSTGALAADAAAGKAVFGTKCRSCHGPNGEGNPAIAKMMKVEMKPLGESTADVKKVVTDGQ